MRIAIMGAGGIGGYYGAKLAASGNEVVFIARGAHLDAIRSRGFSLVGPAGDVHLPKAAATDDPSSLAPVDVVLFCVKLFDTEAAAWEWAYSTFPAALYTSGTLSIYVTDKKHCDIANAVIASPLNIVPMGVSVDVDFLFHGGALSFVTDP